MVKNDPRMRFCVEFFHWIWLKLCQIKMLLVLYFSTKSTFLEKLLFVSYRPKCSCSINLQDCLILNICGRSQSISWNFLHRGCHQGSIAPETTTFRLIWQGRPTHAQTFLDYSGLPVVDLGQTARLKIIQRLINAHNFNLWAKKR